MHTTASDSDVRIAAAAVLPSSQRAECPTKPWESVPETPLIGFPFVVVAVVVDVVVSWSDDVASGEGDDVGGGAASRDVGAVLLSPPLNTSTSASTTAAVNSTIVATIRPTWPWLNRRAGRCGRGCGAGAWGGGVGYAAENCRVDGGAAGGATGAALGARSAAAAAARASSPAEAYRSAGAFAMPWATTSSNARVMPRRMMLGRGGGANMCALITCRRSAASNGARPVSISYSRHASE